MKCIEFINLAHSKYYHLNINIVICIKIVFCFFSKQIFVSHCIFYANGNYPWSPVISGAEELHLPSSNWRQISRSCLCPLLLPSVQADIPFQFGKMTAGPTPDVSRGWPHAEGLGHMLINSCCDFQKNSRMSVCQVPGFVQSAEMFYRQWNGDLEASQLVWIYKASTWQGQVWNPAHMVLGLVLQHKVCPPSLWLAQGAHSEKSRGSVLLVSVYVHLDSSHFSSF